MPHIPRSRTWLLLAVTLILQIVLTRSARLLKHDLGHHDPAVGLELFKRSQDDTARTTLLSLPYSEWYESAPTAIRPFILLLLILILTFLFSFIGISASDFFCPNLSTIAAYLGLNESTAGVTFLAFGNGSPDVFSTFASLKSGGFGLAVGELIGAASFIVSIVVGSIALIRPFHVPRHAFLRDVLFFTAAVIVLITVLHDGRLSIVESGCMVLLYVAYVSVVVGGNWWNRRQRKKETWQQLGWDNHGAQIPDGEEDAVSVSPTTIVPPSPSERHPNVKGQSSPSSLHPSDRSLSSTLPPVRIKPPHGIRSLTQTSHLDHLIEDPSSSDYATDTPRATFSLLGAIEFRDVVNSLRKESSRTPSPQRTPTGLRDTNDYFGPIEAYTHRRSSSVGFPLNVRAPSRSGSLRGRQRSHTHAPHHDESSRSRVFSAPPARRSSDVQATPEPNPWQDEPGHPPTPDLSGSRRSPAKPTNLRLKIPGQIHSSRPTHSSIPSISIFDPSGAEAPPVDSGGPISQDASSTESVATESRFRFRHRTRVLLRMLFPSLQSFRHKSYIGMMLSITSVPAVLALTLTLPVVDDGRRDEGVIALPEGMNEPLSGARDGTLSGEDDGDADSDRLLTADVGEELHHLVEGGFSPLHSPLGRIHHSALWRLQEDVEAGTPYDAEEDEQATKELVEEMHAEEALEFHKSLTAAQCILGPAFCALIIFQGASYLLWIELGVVIAGLIGGTVVMMVATDGSSQPWKLIRCFAGFVCSMVWIAAIADEVVSVLQVVGEILGLSDAIVGLTIFAVGNSLADLVANVTVAQFAPAMAYAACFGGPMLNLLLGIGGSGTWHMLTHDPSKPVTVHFSPTLWVSASGLVLVLVATAFVVPMNGYLIDRRWACCLIVAYLCLMMVNVLVEFKTGRD
ncbi:Sodium/calcium exchanger protein-domain-containing protein [Naematelia encephala]|uniref:Sodium/calcium exchanger protein-domain-containing protein n=1 Tax=Naematelia encephala TaxID=71784 RepID=A0A1Y2BLL7_9TREE|nr:Sodium/calcium exchanger protein-domain-containing protein [Naematelia encephala]